MILIRADANEQIGVGHVMRCISIAHALRDKGEELLFITADHVADDMIRNAGFEAECLNSDWAQLEKENMAAVMKKHHPDLILVDSYFVSEKYFQLLNSFARTVYLDDLNADCWDVDILVNYNIFADTFDYSGYEQTKTRLLTGSDYAPLRREFINAAPHTIRETVADILISAGGADPEGISVQILRGLCPKWKNIRFHFVIGALNPHLEEIHKLAGKNVILHIQENCMAKLMRECDMAISAAGSTLYELCACGTPTITFTMADNQLMAAMQFQKLGIMEYAGDCRNHGEFVAQIQSTLYSFVSQPNKRLYCSREMQTIVDGRGTERLANELLLMC